MKTKMKTHRALCGLLSGLLLRALFTPLLAIAAMFAAPAAVHAGVMYVSSGSQTIDKVSSGGAVSLFATVPAGSNPYGLAFDNSGNLYVADIGTNQISKITPGGAVSLFASVPTPTGLAFDSSGTLYAAEASTGQIVKISGGGAVSFFASVSSNVHGLAFDGSGNLYAADSLSNQISMITSGGAVSTFATGISSPRFIAFSAVPEPGTALFGMACAGVAALRRRRNSAV